MKDQVQNQPAALLEQAKRIRAWQEERKLSDSQILRDLPGLGSTKTYTRILEGDLEDLDTDRWLRDYAAVWEVIQIMDAAGENGEEIYPDLTTVLDLRKAVADAMRETGNNRLILVQGPSGSGKTTAAKLLALRYGGRVRVCEATEIWKENPNTMLGAMLVAFGVKTPPPAASDKFDLLISKLNASRVCLVIDEAHHLGTHTLNLVKSILNQSQGEIVLLAMGTLWSRLETQAYAEARQLIHNRLAERIRYEAVELADVEKLLERRLGLNGEAKAAAAALRAAASGHGELGFVKLVCRQARKLAGKSPITTEILGKAIASVSATR